MARASIVPPKRHSSVSARTFLPLAVIFAVLIGATFLPPDSSLSEVDRTGRLSVCMPDAYPPLVTGDPDQPGFDVELLQAITDRLGWRLNIVSNTAMGRNFNPRTWRINRAQCQMLAGGIALNPTTKSFLDTSNPYLETGWAFAAAPDITFKEIEGPVGVFVGLTGLDRIALGQFLRERDVAVVIVDSANALVSGLEDGAFLAAITEALLAEHTFVGTGYAIDFMPPPFEQLPLGLGFWKGDLTLKRKIEVVLDELRAEQFIDALASEYGITDALQH
ncbi:substrate-binding periplasmic protein [Pelagibacterium xiamenense]|uniref:substrate-binding periplasmic protein n=1 Tax=Pelagibacterium xiamenense TaxID=2901140 RepID=UPI001E3688F9|nr:transporter substrate-binding domain-containing protein [Pelagibacterium xiamenense]MCD7059566.1 transporter substrate-binding domain-containing protein [Pelagibacterium xiamenense]